MARNELFDRANGDIVRPSTINRIHKALSTDLIGRGTNGAPKIEQNLGTSTYEWLSVNAKKYYLNNLELTAALLSAKNNDIISGLTRSTSDQAAFLVPSGSALSFTISGSSTALVYKVNGQLVNMISDLGESALTAGPSANHTCLVNDATFLDQDWTRVAGDPHLDPDNGIAIDTLGSGVTARLNSFQSFEVNGEYFWGYLTASKISNIYRGFYYDENSEPIERQVLSNNDVITLLETGYVFLGNDGVTVTVNYEAPSYGPEEPGSPSTGDYWYDTVNALWKTYNGASFVNATATFIGWVVMDSSACVGARSVEFANDYNENLSIDLEIFASNQVRGNGYFSSVNAGPKITKNASLFNWVFPTDFAAATDTYTVAQTDDKLYFLYVSQDGEEIISDHEPYYYPERQGFYHPHNTWRCVAKVTSDSSALINLTPLVFNSSIGDRKDFFAYHAIPSTPIVSTSWTTTSDDTWVEFKLMLSSPVEGSNFRFYSNGGAARMDVVAGNSDFYLMNAGWYKLHLTCSNDSDVQVPIISMQLAIFDSTTDSIIWEETGNVINMPTDLRDTYSFYTINFYNPYPNITAHLRMRRTGYDPETWFLRTTSFYLSYIGRR